MRTEVEVNLQRKTGGAGGVRTRDLLDAIEARSQLRYGPTECKYCCSFYSILRMRPSNNSLTMESTTQCKLREVEPSPCRYGQNNHTTPVVENAANRWNRHTGIGT